jgi:hypothetical protein
MSFFVTLPSNASMDYYDNVVSHFTTKLANPIKLDGDWVVGISKVLFRNSIQSSLGYFTVLHNGKKIKLEMACYDGDLISQVFADFNLHLADILKKLPNDFPVPFVIEIKDDSQGYKKLKIIPKDTFSFSIGGYLADILHVPDSDFLYNKNHPFEARIRDIEINMNESMFIYSDIIEDQYVGDSRSKLLDTLSIKGKKDEVVTIELENPNYVNLNKSEISSINISLRDSTGELIHFSKFAEFIIKLHFKPKSYE